MNTPELLVIGGKPYSGKSTISKAFVEFDGDKVISHLSMGERLRAISCGAIASRHTALVSNSAQQLKNHAPVPAEAPILVFEEFVDENPSDLIVLDGFPRYMNRLQTFKESAQRLGTNIIAVCKVNVGTEVIYERSHDRGQRYEDIAENVAFIDRRLAEFRDGPLQVITALSKEYPYYELDGTLPINRNADALQDIYRTHTERV